MRSMLMPIVRSAAVVNLSVPLSDCCWGCGGVREELLAADMAEAEDSLRWCSGRRTADRLVLRLEATLPPLREEATLEDAAEASEEAVEALRRGGGGGGGGLGVPKEEVEDSEPERERSVPGRRCCCCLLLLLLLAAASLALSRIDSSSRLLLSPGGMVRISIPIRC